MGNIKGRNQKVRNSFGVKDIYRHIRKNHWYDIGCPVTEKDFYAIIRNVNNMLAENISDGKLVVLPSKMGSLELKKTPVGVRLKNGKLKITYPIDWKKTRELWEEDEEARKQNILVRFENDYVYYVHYRKFGATYNNKLFYHFVLNAFIKRTIKDNINNGKLDSLWSRK